MTTNERNFVWNVQPIVEVFNDGGGEGTSWVGVQGIISTKGTVMFEQNCGDCDGSVITYRVRLREFRVMFDNKK